MHAVPLSILSAFQILRLIAPPQPGDKDISGRRARSGQLPPVCTM